MTFCAREIRTSFTAALCSRLRNWVACEPYGANPSVQSPIGLSHFMLAWMSSQIMVSLQKDQHLPGSWWPPRVMCHHGACCWSGSLEVMDLHQYDISQCKCENCQMETGKPTPLPSATRRHRALLKGTIWSWASIEISTLSTSEVRKQKLASQSFWGREVKWGSLFSF